MAREVVLRVLGERMSALGEPEVSANPKSALQEAVQAEGLPSPTYRDRARGGGGPRPAVRCGSDGRGRGGRQGRGEAEVAGGAGGGGGGAEGDRFTTGVRRDRGEEEAKEYCVGSNGRL